MLHGNGCGRGDPKIYCSPFLKNWLRQCLKYDAEILLYRKASQQGYYRENHVADVLL